MTRYFRLTAFIVAAAAVWYSASAGSTWSDSTKAACKETPHHLGHYFSIGGAMVDNSAVTDRVESLGYPGFSRYSLSFAFGGLRRFGRYVSGGEIEALTRKPNRGEFYSSFSAGRLLSLHGVSLLSSQNVALYPLVGIGMGVSSLKIKRTETDFDAALNNPPVTQMHSEMVSQMTMLIDLGIGFQLSRPAYHGRPAFKTIGLRAGYMLDPLDNTTWRRGDAVLDNGPHSNLSGPYVRLTMGKIGGGAYDKRHCRSGKEQCCPTSCAHMKNAGKAGCCPHMKDASKAGCCPHMKDASKAGCCPHMKDMGKAGCCPHMKDMGKAGCCPHMKDAAKPVGCPMMKDAAPAQPEETKNPPPDTNAVETK